MVSCPNPDPRKNRTPDIGPQEKPDPKYRASVKQNTDLILRGLTVHDKYIDAALKCIGVSANSLRQQANELCILDVQGQCKRAERNCIDGLQRLRMQYLFFAINKSITESSTNFTAKSDKILSKSIMQSGTFCSHLSEQFLPSYHVTP